ncbi:DUF1841 family protein [bacterium]|nr:DUF1841 family protein [bacterium]
MMNTATDMVLERLLQQDLYGVWEQAKRGDLGNLDPVDKLMAENMLDHKTLYSQKFDNPSEQPLEDCGPDNDIDPYVHMIFHTVIEYQLVSGDPAQVALFLDSMLQQKVSRHDAIHLIGRFLSELLYDVMVEDQPFDQQRYQQLLKRYTGKSPEKILESIDQGFAD